MRKSHVVVLAIIAALAIAYSIWSRRSSTPAESAPIRDAGTGTTATATATAQSLTDAATVIAIQHVRKLSPDERRRLADQITAARASARAAAAKTSGTAPSADDTIALEQVSGTVKTALEEAIPLLAECYARGSAGSAAGKTAAVTMTLYSDPSIGTVIDTDAMKDLAGKPLEASLDDCLRTTIESLGLPPLGTGGHLPLQYSFVFD
ncbi:MAG: hypothetical protein ABI867_25755 [Kofleriaceae bacterium]